MHTKIQAGINMKSGKVTGNAYKRSVLKPITYKRDEVVSGAGVGADCAIFAVPEGYLLTSCMQEAAVAVEADMGFVIGHCANRLAAAGAAPVAAIIGIVLPESAQEPELKQWIVLAQGALKELNMQLAGAHATVSKAVKCAFVTVSVYGMIPKSYDDKAALPKAAPGQDIVISKWIGLEGSAMLAREYKESLLSRYPAYLIEEAEGFAQYLSVIPEAAVAVKSGACAMQNVSEGGIFAALWELAERSGVGLTIDLKKLPIRQETVEICEHIGGNPYILLSGGCLIMTAADGQLLVDALEKAGIPARIVGKITDSKERLILNEDEVRYMDRPAEDEIYRLLSERN